MQANTALFGKAPRAAPKPAPSRALPNGHFDTSSGLETSLEPLAAYTGEEKPGK